MNVARVPMVVWTDGEQQIKPVKFSDLLLQYARPLTKLLKPSDNYPSDLAQTLEMATVCWNAPYRQAGDRDVAYVRNAIKQMPEPYQKALSEMLDARLSGEHRFNAFPFLLESEVEEKEPGVATVHAYAVSVDTGPAFIASDVAARTGVNERCPCGSGRKYKRCCG